MLLHGPAGLGKTTLAHIIATEMGVGMKAVTGPVIERPVDLSALLSQLEERTVFFVDEVHRLNRVVEEILYPAMEDYELDIMLGKGPSAQAIKLDLKRFTLVGATTRQGLLTAPLRARFGVVIRLGYYTQEEMHEIVRRSARILDIEIREEGAREIARRSRGTPRVGNRLLRRVRDYAQVKAEGIITAEVARRGLEMLQVDGQGLDEMDKRILTTILRNFGGGPVGLKSLGAALSEEPDTLEEVNEPYLIQEGYLERTAKGRRITARGRKYLGASVPGGEQGELLSEGG